MDFQEFRRQLRIFTTSHDVKEHDSSILAMLDPLDLDIEYRKMIYEGGITKIRDVFSSFAHSVDEEWLSSYERERLSQVGRLTEQYFLSKDYHAFSLMIFRLTIETLAEAYDFGDVIDFSLIKMSDVYSVVPQDIYLQLFLLESMSDKDVFDWSRDSEIISASLIVLTVCFSDIYEFMLEEDDDSIDQAFDD